MANNDNWLSGPLVGAANEVLTSEILAVAIPAGRPCCRLESMGK